MSRAMERSAATRSATLLLLWALCDFANDEGEAYPSNASLMKRTRLAKSSIKRALTELVDLGEVVVVEGGHGRARRRVVRILIGLPEVPDAAEIARHRRNKTKTAHPEPFSKRAQSEPYEKRAQIEPPKRAQPEPYPPPKRAHPGSKRAQSEPPYNDDPLRPVSVVVVDARESLNALAIELENSLGVDRNKSANWWFFPTELAKWLSAGSSLGLSETVATDAIRGVFAAARGRQINSPAYFRNPVRDALHAAAAPFDISQEVSDGAERAEAKAVAGGGSRNRRIYDLAVSTARRYRDGSG